MSWLFFLTFYNNKAWRLYFDQRCNAWTKQQLSWSNSPNSQSRKLKVPKGNFNAVHKTYDHFTVELFKNSILVQLAENCWIFDKNSHIKAKKWMRLLHRVRLLKCSFSYLVFTHEEAVVINGRIFSSDDASFAQAKILRFFVCVIRLSECHITRFDWQA